MWFYLAPDNTMTGPVDTQSVMDLVEDGIITAETIIIERGSNQRKKAIETRLYVLFDDDPSNDDEAFTSEENEEQESDSISAEELSFHSLEQAYGKDFLFKDAQGNHIIKFMGDEFNPGHAIFEVIYMIKNDIYYTSAFPKNYDSELRVSALSHIFSANSIDIENLSFTTSDKSLFEISSFINDLKKSLPIDPSIMDKSKIEIYRDKLSEYHAKIDLPGGVLLICVLFSIPIAILSVLTFALFVEKGIFSPPKYYSYISGFITLSIAVFGNSLIEKKSDTEKEKEYFNSIYWKSIFGCIIFFMFLIYIF